MDALVRAHDWSSTPLGPMVSWPQGLRTVADLVLACPLAMVVLWGPDLVQIYNDAYAAIAGEKHPRALGQPTRECWPEVWPIQSPIYEAVFRNEARSYASQRLTIDRGGVAVHRWFDLNYSPLRDDAGAVGGLLVTVVETTDEMLGERRLAAQIARQRRLFERAPGFITILRGPDLVFEFVNDAYARLFGGRDFIGRTVREVFPDIADQGYFELLEGAFATGQRFVAEHTRIVLQHAPGAPEEERFLDFIYEPIIDETGAVTGLFVQGHDVTNAHLAQEALRMTERRQAFRIALDDTLRNLSDPREVMAAAAEALGRHLNAGRCSYGEVDETGAFVTVDGDWTDGAMPSALGRFRLDDFGPELVVEGRAGRTIRIADTLDDPRIDADAAAAFARSGTRATLTAPLVKDGRLLAQLYVTQGEPRRWTDEDETLARETGERTWAAVGRARAEAALHAANANLERQVAERTRELSRTWQVSPDLLGVANADGRFESTNPAWQGILGWSTAEIAATPLIDLVHEDDRAATRAGFERLGRGEPVLRFENRYRRKDGEWRWLSWVAVPEGGKFYCSARDVTADKAREAELRTVEDALRQAQKLDALGQLTGGVAHDFNNLLTVIRGSVELLMRPNLTEERRQRYIVAIADTSARAAKLTGQLLAFARRQALRPEVFDAGQGVLALSDMIGTLTGSRIRVETRLPEEP